MALRDEQQRLRQEERKYLATHADELLDRLRARLDDVIANEAQPYVNQLELIAIEVGGIIESVGDIRRAAGDNTGTIDVRKFGVGQLVSAVDTGADLLAAPERRGLTVMGSTPSAPSTTTCSTRASSPTTRCAA